MQQAAWFKLLCPGAKLGVTTLCSPTVGGEENPRRALPDSSSEGGGCLVFLTVPPPNQATFFLAKIPCKQVWHFFESLQEMDAICKVFF